LVSTTRLRNFVVALTSPDGAIAAYGAAEFEAFSGISPSVVAGGTRAWQEAGSRRLGTGRYHRPFRHYVFAKSAYVL
jgi:hypothetical protein